MKQPKFPTIPTVLSILAVAVIVYFFYSFYFSFYRVPVFILERVPPSILKKVSDASLVLMFFGIAPILTYLYYKIADYRKELESEKIERILEILEKYQINEEDYREVLSIFWGYRTWLPRL